MVALGGGPVSYERVTPVLARECVGTLFEAARMLLLIVSGLVGEVSREEKMALRGTDPESYITEYTLVYEVKSRNAAFQHAVLTAFRSA